MVAALVDLAGPSGEYGEQIRPGRTREPRLVIVAHGTASDASSYLVPRAPTVGHPDGGHLPQAAALATVDGWAFAAGAFGGGDIRGTYDVELAQTRLWALADACRTAGGRWGGCDPGPPVLVGVSMGMITVTAALAARPGDVAGIVGVVPAISPTYTWPLWAQITPPADVAAADPEAAANIARYQTLTAQGRPVEVWSVRGDLITDTADEAHHREWAETVGATRLRIAVGTHGTTRVTGRLLRQFLARA